MNHRMGRQLDLKDLRRPITLEVCYLCGDGLDDGGPTNKDHVPPKSWFSQTDRERSPLIVVVHQECHDRLSDDDEAVGELLAFFDSAHDDFKQASVAPTKLLKVTKQEHTLHSPRMLEVTGVRLERAIWRWMAAFHAVLYGVTQDPDPALPRNGCVIPPYPHSNTRGGFDRVPSWHGDVVQRIRAAVLSRQASWIRAFGGGLQYAETWRTDGQGHFECSFVFQLRSFQRAASHPDTGRAFAGWIQRKSLPPGASLFRPLAITLPAQGTSRHRVDLTTLLPAR